MQNPVRIEDLDKTVRPFHDAAYRQWEREFEQNLAEKPLPPLPRVPLPVVQQRADQPVESLAEEGKEHTSSSSPIRQPQPTAQKLQRNGLGPVEGNLFPPVQTNSEWERRAQRMALRERVKEEDAEFKSMWSPVSVDEEKGTKRCCCVM